MAGTTRRFVGKPLPYYWTFPRTCPVCKGKFLPANPGFYQLLCSKECRRERIRQQYRAQSGAERQGYMREYKREWRNHRDRKAQAFSVLMNLLEKSDADEKTKEAIRRLRESVEG